MKKNKCSYIFILLFTLVRILVFFFSWTSSPSLSSLRWLPRWIAHWADKTENMNLRTAIPMIFGAFLQDISLLHLP